MQSNHLIHWHPLLLLLSIFPSIRDFSKELAVHIRWPKNTGASASVSVLPTSMQDWFPLRWGNSGRLYLGDSKITADGDCCHEIKRHLLLGRKVMANLDSIFKSRHITLPTKVRLVKAMVFPLVMYGCESWTVKKAEHRRIDAFELWCCRRLLSVPWTARRSIQPVHPKGNGSWIFIGRTDAEAETPILYPPDTKNWLIWKDLDAGKNWGWEEKGMTEDEMIGWHHRLNGHEFE